MVIILDCLSSVRGSNPRITAKFEEVKLKSKIERKGEPPDKPSLNGVRVRVLGPVCF